MKALNGILGEKFKKGKADINNGYSILSKHIVDTDKQAKEKFEILMKQMLDKKILMKTWRIPIH